jgi:hypothetical protein
MKDHTFIITYEGAPLVVVHNTQYKLPTDVLDWYASEYAFERSKLGWSAVHSVTMP